MAKGIITKQTIANAMLEMCKEVPFSKITVQKITAVVGINRQTFYYHFSDKYALLRWFYHADSLSFLESSEVSLDNWEEQALKMLKAMKNKAAFYKNTVTSDPTILLNEFSQIIRKLFINLFENVDEDKELSEEDKKFYSRFFSYGCSGVLIDWILEDFKDSPLTIASQLFRMAKDTEFFSYRLYAQEQSKEEWRLK